MRQETLRWILDWFRQRNPGADIDVQANYYQCQLVDSFGIIELIGDLEDHFSIQFNDGDFKQPLFRTIQGLTRLVEDHRRS